MNDNTTKEINDKINDKITKIQDMLKRCRVTEGLYVKKHAELSSVWDAYITAVRESYVDRAKHEKKRREDDATKADKVANQIKELEQKIQALRETSNSDKAKILNQLKEALEANQLDEKTFRERLRTIEDEQRIMLHNVKRLHHFPRPLLSVTHTKDDYLESLLDDYRDPDLLSPELSNEEWLRQLFGGRHASRTGDGAGAND